MIFWLVYDFPYFLNGDIDGYGKISILDVRLLLQAYITNTWTEEDFPIMDMDDNLTVNILDVRLLLQSSGQHQGDY